MANTDMDYFTLKNNKMEDRRMKKGMISVLSAVGGAALGATVVSQIGKKGDDKWKEMADKHLTLMLLMNQWLRTKQEGKSILDYFAKNEIKTIAIYGMSYVGERLYEELLGTEIKMEYAIDKNADGIYSDITLLTPESELPDVDAIIVTPVFYFDEIEEMLSEKTMAKILSLEDILYEL